jgi:hypothetical protein
VRFSASEKNTSKAMTRARLRQPSTSRHGRGSTASGHGHQALFVDRDGCPAGSPVGAGRGRIIVVLSSIMSVAGCHRYSPSTVPSNTSPTVRADTRIGLFFALEPGTAFGTDFGMQPALASIL